MSSCGNCYLETECEPLCESCNAEDEAYTAELEAKIEALKARLAWFERRQKLVDDLLTVYRVMADPDNESIVEAVGRLFDFDVTDPEPKPSEGFARACTAEDTNVLGDEYAAFVEASKPSEGTPVEREVIDVERQEVLCRVGNPHDRPDGGNVTIDEAKAWIDAMKADFEPGDEQMRALDIALWLMEAHPHLLTAIEDYDDIEAVDAAKEWLSEHPRPGSQPPMTDDGPGNTL